MDEETAKAAQELAKASGKLVDAATKVGGFIVKVVGDTAVELGGALHDWTKYYRYTNLLRLQDKVEALHASRKLEGKTIPIPPRFAIPLLQAASQEDDESIQDLWAGLIANATDPQRRIQPKKVFVDILSQLEPLDARVLQFLAGQNWKLFAEVPGGGITLAKLANGVDASKEDLKFSLLNLHRLGCVVDQYALKWKDLDGTGTGLRLNNDDTTYLPSPLGFALLSACNTQKE